MAFSLPITRIRVDPSGSVIAVARGSSLHFFSAETGIQIPLSGEHHSGVIRSIAFNESGGCLVSAGDDKQLKVWSKTTDGWKNIATVKAPKKMTAAQFSHNDKTIIFSDKLGDVLHFPISIPADHSPITNLTEQPQVILGHYSSVTSMILSADGKYIITGDKDEHVRVSNYPQGYDIESFCLGHTEFVSGLLVSKKHPDLLVSGGGDGTLKLWNLKSGKLLDTVFIGDNKDKKSEDADTIIPLDIYEATQSIIVAVEEKPIVYFFNITDNKLVQNGSLDLKTPIGSAAFDTKGNIWASHLPIDQLHINLAEHAAATTTTTTATTTTTTATPMEVSTPAPGPSDQTTSQTQGQTSGAKLVLLVLEGGKYKLIEEAENITKINNQLADPVEKALFFSTLHELSKNFQFRKRFGDGEFAMNISNHYANPGQNKNDGRKKGKKKAKHQNEASEKNDPVVPNFVE